MIIILGYFRADEPWVREGLKSNNYHRAPKSNRQNLRDRTLDLPYWFRDNTCGRICFIYWLSEFPWSGVANRFELR